MQYKSYYQSPIGIFEIIIENDTLIALTIVDKIQSNHHDNEFITKIKIQLDEYFNKKRKNFNIKIEPSGTDFQKRVWNELLKIPYGKTMSYSDIARNIGNKNFSRAIGNACNKNPVMLIIPCHRVISKTGDLSGFAFGVNIKKYLLNLEKNNLLLI